MSRSRPQRTLLSLAASVLLPAFGAGDAAFEAVEEGNGLYLAGDYAAAAKRYEAAAQLLPEAAEIRFNQGNARFKSFDYDLALEHYAAALATANEPLASRIEYNIGVVKYRQALDSMQTLQDALSSTGEAIRHLRKSLQLRPGQADARYNLELAHRLQAAILEQKVEAQRNAETRDQKTSDNQGQPFMGEPDQRISETSPPDPASQPDRPSEHQKGQPNAGTAVQADQLRQMPDAGQQEQLTRAAAEQLLELFRERAQAAQSRSQSLDRARISNGQLDKYW